MKLFFDTEFTGLHQHTTLISLGIISEHGDKFYAEFIDYDKNQVNEWIRENVINNLKFSSQTKICKINNIDGKIIVGVKDDTKGIKEKLSEFLQVLNHDRKTNYELYSDVCHYDMVLFAELFGGAFELPKNVNAVCHDINQDIASYYQISEREAFDKNREDIIREHNSNHPLLNTEDDKHNSLYDAKVIKTIYNIIHNNS